MIVIERSSIKIVHAHNARQQVYFFDSVKEMVAGNDPDTSPQLCRGDLALVARLQSCALAFRQRRPSPTNVHHLPVQSTGQRTNHLHLQSSSKCTEASPSTNVSGCLIA